MYSGSRRLDVAEIARRDLEGHALNGAHDEGGALLEGVAGLELEVVAVEERGEHEVQLVHGDLLANADARANAKGQECRLGALGLLLARELRRLTVS